MASDTSYYAGLDIGGTTVKAVLVNHLAEQVGPLAEVRSMVKNGYEATFGQLDSALDQLAAGAGVERSAIAGIGLDVPAPSSDGVIWGRANLGEDWVGTDIRGKLSQRTGVPVYMTNDGNAAALGEYALRPKHTGDTSVEEKAFKLREFAEKGDALAVQIFKQQGFILGYAIADMVRTLDPGLVVIGGGLAETSFRDQYMTWIDKGFADRAWPVYRFSPLDSAKVTTQFEWAIGGDAAAAIGMAYTAQELFHR